MFLFSLYIEEAESSLVKREQKGNLSPRVTLAFIYLALALLSMMSPAMADTVESYARHMPSQILYLKILSSYSIKGLNIKMFYYNPESECVAATQNLLIQTL